MKDGSEVFIEDETPIPPPIPYYASLCKVLGGATLALVVTYLEIHHPPPNDATRTPAGPSSAPVFVGCDQICEAIGVNRRTLHIALYRMCVWWRNEEARSAALRSGREFLNADHSKFGKVKPYSIVGSRQFTNPQTLTFRRNYGRINQILTQAHIDGWHEPLHFLRNMEAGESDASASSSSLLMLPQIIQESLRIRVRNGWTEARREAQSAKMTEIWEMRKKSGWSRK